MKDTVYTSLIGFKYGKKKAKSYKDLNAEYEFYKQLKKNKKQ